MWAQHASPSLSMTGIQKGSTMPDVRIQLDLWIPMRDGTRLYGVLYRPPTGDHFPVLLKRSPYSTQRLGYIDWAMDFAQHGYAVVLQDCRGRYESEGKWRP